MLHGEAHRNRHRVLKMNNGSNSIRLSDEIYPTYTDHNGFLMPKGFPVAGFESGLMYRATANDFFVASYPKCGTTWCQYIVYLILNRGVPLHPNDKLEMTFPHLEEVGATAIEHLPTFNGGYRLIKTHLPYHMTPLNPQAKYLYVVRNPKDCCVSFYHHTKGFVKHYNFAQGSFDAFFHLFLKGQVDFGDYFDNVLSWHEHKSDGNVLFVTYEDLLKNTRRSILKIASFLGEEYKSQLLENGEAVLLQVMEHSTFGSMHKDQGRWCSERPKEHPRFIREGAIGNWKSYLTKSQSEALDQVILDRMSTDTLIDIWGVNYESILW